MERKEFIFIIHHFAVESRARSAKKLLAIAFKKSFSFRFAMLCALEERYIVTAASDIYFCKHPHKCRGSFVRSRRLKCLSISVRIFSLDGKSDKKKEKEK